MSELLLGGKIWFGTSLLLPFNLGCMRLFLLFPGVAWQLMHLCPACGSTAHYLPWAQECFHATFGRVSGLHLEALSFCFERSMLQRIFHEDSRYQIPGYLRFLVSRRFRAMTQQQRCLRQPSYQWVP